MVDELRPLLRDPNASRFARELLRANKATALPASLQAQTLGVLHETAQANALLASVSEGLFAGANVKAAAATMIAAIGVVGTGAYVLQERATTAHPTVAVHDRAGAEAVEVASTTRELASTETPSQEVSQPETAHEHEAVLALPTQISPRRSVQVAVRANEPEVTVDPIDSMLEELLLIRRARTALSENNFVDATRALALHQESFPAGELATEREVLRGRLPADVPPIP